jgi:hypothetical protein
MTLTLRTLLAYLDDTLPPSEAKILGEKLAKSDEAKELVERIKKVIRKRSLSTPTSTGEGGASDPNTVAAYLSDKLSSEQLPEFEKIALESDAHLAEVAACHQILTLVLSEQMRVPPPAYRRMYTLVKGRESIPTRTPGQSIPVGGAGPGEKHSEADDADAHYLLGLPAYSRSRPIGERILRVLTAALLGVGFIVSAWLAWPKTAPRTNGTSGREVAKVPPTTDTDDKKSDDKKSDEKKETHETLPSPMPITEPDPKPAPPKEDLTPAKTPPREGRIAVGKFDSPDSKILLARKADTDVWTRVAKGNEVMSSDRLVCLPGYTALMTFETGAKAELWANMDPDLLPVRVFETSITLHPPYDGFDADLTLHTGRVYFSAGRAAGAAVRVRFHDEVWDITLPDSTSEVAVEVQHLPVPGAVAERPMTTGVVFVMKGTAALKVRFKTIPKVSAGEMLVWDSKGGTLMGPRKPEAPGGANGPDFNKTPVYPTSKTAQPMQKALSDFADRIKDAQSVPAALSELRTEPNGAPSAAYFAGVRFSLFGSAALGELSTITDALNDGNRQDIRSNAVDTLQHHLATYPEAEAQFRTLAGTKLRLSEESTTQLLRTLRGFTPAERTDSATLQKLIHQLTAEEVCQREVALFMLLTQIDPAAQQRPGLVYDVGGPAEVREAGAKEWQKRIEELAKSKK